MKAINDLEDFDDIVDKNELVLIDFTATWCVPCKKLMPTLEEISKELPNINFIKADIEAVPELAEEFNIDAVPTLVLLKGREEVSRQQGALNKTALKDWLTKSSG